MNALAVYDKELAVERAGGSVELATDLFGMLLQELPGYRRDMVAALDSNNLHELQRFAHKLHGSATYTGVSALRHAVATLESSLKRGETEGVSAQLSSVMDEIDRVLHFAESAA